MIDEYIEKLKCFSLEELEILHKNLIKEKDSRKSEKYIYKHDCFHMSRYHIGKYKHYAKIITAIDDSKSNGYAFSGQFLNLSREELVPEGSYILEVCDSSVKLYRMDKESKELLLEGYTGRYASFIKKAKEITCL